MKIACCKDNILINIIIADSIGWCEQYMNKFGYDLYLDVTNCTLTNELTVSLQDNDVTIPDPDSIQNLNQFLAMHGINLPQND